MGWIVPIRLWGLTGGQDYHCPARPSPATWRERRRWAVGLCVGEFCLLTHCSVLSSLLCRSSSVTRSTVMKRTCRKNLQPLKVSWGWLPTPPRRAGWAPPPPYTNPHPQGQAAPVLHPQYPSSRRAVRRDAQPGGTGPSSLACGPRPALPFPPFCCPAGLRLAPARPCPGPARSRGPSTQSALCSSPCLSPCAVEHLGSPCGEWTFVSPQWGRGQSFCPLNLSSTG